MRMRLLVPSVAAALALAAAGCGGGSGSSAGSASSGASSAGVVPASAPIFISVNSDLSSSQWDKVDALSKKFPDRGKALASIRQSMQKDGVDFEKDVKPALGKEVDIAFLDLKHGGNDAIVITKPKDEQKLNAALAKGSTAPKHATVDGWTVYADKQRLLDRFKTASGKGKHLADDAGFKAATSGQPDETIAKVYIRGTALRDAIAQSARSSGSPFDPSAITGGNVRWISVTAAAADDGIKLEGVEKGNQPVQTYTPSLTGVLPAGALVALSFDNLQKGLRKSLDQVAKADPSFQSQEKQAEQALGFSVNDDVLPLFSGEGAFALYPAEGGTTVPTIDLVLKVQDEQKATRLLDRLGALSAMGGGAGATAVTVDGLKAKKLALGKYAVVYAAFDGKLVLSTSEAGLAAIHGGGQKLEDDALFKQTRSNADASGDTTGFFYANLQNGLSKVYDAAASSGNFGSSEQEVLANSKPLRALYLGSSKNGDKLEVHGFLTVK